MEILNMKNIIIEILKQLLEFCSIFELVEERIHNFKDRFIEIM